MAERRASLRDHLKRRSQRIRYGLRVANLSGSVATLYSFTGQADGGLPWTPLLEVSDGVFYGTTLMGTGASSNGTLFRITQNGTLTTLHTFTGGADGEYPEQLILGTDGNLYGTAQLRRRPRANRTSLYR